MHTFNKPVALIVGGSSGLGWELGQLFKSSYRVIVTGRHTPIDESVEYVQLDLAASSPLKKNPLNIEIDQKLRRIPRIELLVYCAGYYQQGYISDLSDTELKDMVQVGLLAPGMILQRIISEQRHLSGFIAITSTSQWTPRALEPMYTAVKAGLGMLANSVSLDDRVERVLVVGPGGMRTNFWKDSGKDTGDMLDPKWVAEQIDMMYHGEVPFKYKVAKIPRGANLPEILEVR